jgi:hypothetical protein
VENDIIKLLTEIAHNTLQGNIPLNTLQLKRLRKYKQMLRTLSNRAVSLREKRDLVVRQRGGFLPILLPIIASAVGGLVSQLANQ